MRNRHVGKLLAAGIVLFLGGATVAGGAQGPTWSYSGITGPANWGGLSPGYSLCATGRNQSPVDITAPMAAELASPEFSYQVKGAEVLNTGHTIQMNFSGGGTLEVEGHGYALLQVHFHSPSEHLFSGRSFPLEAHLVHDDGHGQLAVVGVLYTFGAENMALDPILSAMPDQAGKTASMQGVTAESLLPGNRSYYRLNGSLTTPPCTEGVVWLVLKTPVEAAESQVQRLQQAFGGANNRPVQPVHGRVILE